MAFLARASLRQTRPLAFAFPRLARAFSSSASGCCKSVQSACACKFHTIAVQNKEAVDKISQAQALANEVSGDVSQKNRARYVSTAEPATNYNSTDHCWEENQIDENDTNRRSNHYLTVTGARVFYASAVRLAVMKAVGSMSASADVLAMSSIEVDISQILPGTTFTAKWRGKPVFIRRRTPNEIAKANDVNLSELRDPQDDNVRVQRPEWLVIMGVCTHLGCVPVANQGDYNGWFCPCHGSHYDTSGRIRKGPAPLNLEIPKHSFLSDDKVLLG